jgi:hypothetical protein
VFNVEDFQMRVSFDEDLDGQMTRVTLTAAARIKNIQHTVTYTPLDPTRFKGFGKDIKL